MSHPTGNALAQLPKIKVYKNTFEFTVIHAAQYLLQAVWLAEGVPYVVKHKIAGFINKLHNEQEWRESNGEVWQWELVP